MRWSDITPIPARAGIGLRPEHYRQVVEQRPPAGWLEVHSENFFGLGGLPHHYLEQARTRYPLSFHGVGLSLGSSDPLSEAHLQRLRELIDRYQPALVSEHLSWSSVGGRHLHDLLPLPFGEEAVAHVAGRAQRVQDSLKREISIENISAYLRYGYDAMSEPEFLAEVARRAGCGILLDVNNVYVNACNHGFDALAYLEAIPRHKVTELHLAGFMRRRLEDGELLIDTHDRPVAPAVWSLFRQAVNIFGPAPTLIEWDSDLPALDVLLNEATKADDILREEGHAIAG